MHTVVLFEDERVGNFLPLVCWRSLFELSLGRHIVLDRMAQRLSLPVAGVWVRPALAGLASQRCGAPANRPLPDAAVLVNGRWLPDPAPAFPAPPCVGVNNEEVAYVVCDPRLAASLSPGVMLDGSRREEALHGVPRIPAPGRMIGFPWDVIAHLGNELTTEWQPGDACVEAELDPRVVVECRERLHVGQACRIHPTAVLDASAGPVFLSHNVAVGAHAVIQGPIYIGPGTQVNPHAWLHGGNAIGPVCRIGGEVHGCVILGYSNKHHHGFLGHSYVGSWVNLGAGSTNSDLKNTYGPVHVTLRGGDVNTGQTFFGAVIADFVKLGINATIPTGAMIGFSAMVATSHVIPRTVPAFAWVTDEGVRAGDADRLLDVATRVMARRGVDMTDDEVELFLNLGAKARSEA
ncbi:MAG: hypothetical protein HY763_16310 [Planctomycetes bacterium]|nr:hypothetical protein [Planctomycetota bacterium]